MKTSYCRKTDAQSIWHSSEVPGRMSSPHGGKHLNTFDRREVLYSVEAETGISGWTTPLLLTTDAVEFNLLIRYSNFSCNAGPESNCISSKQPIKAEISICEFNPQFISVWAPVTKCNNTSEQMNILTLAFQTNVMLKIGHLCLRDFWNSQSTPSKLFHKLSTRPYVCCLQVWAGNVQ